MLKLPRQVETDARSGAVREALARDVRPLWAEGKFPVPHVALTPALEKALSAAKRERHLVQGLEQIEEQLRNEEQGLANVRERHGTAESGRVSRLVLMGPGGSERFYRNCESILAHHPQRVLGLRVEAAAEQFAAATFGAGRLVKVVLIDHRDPVAAALLALAEG